MDPTAAIGALIQLALTTFVSPVMLTEYLQALAAKAGTQLPPVAKQLVAFVVSSGLVGSGIINLPPIHALGPQLSQALYGLIVWWISMVVHDNVVAPGQPRPAPHA